MFIEERRYGAVPTRRHETTLLGLPAILYQGATEAAMRLEEEDEVWIQGVQAIHVS